MNKTTEVLNQESLGYEYELINGIQPYEIVCLLVSIGICFVILYIPYLVLK